MLGAANVLLIIAMMNGLEADPLVRERRYPLKDVFCTSDQAGLKPLPYSSFATGAPTPYAADLRSLRRENKGVLPNVFLVRGADIGAAIKATGEVLLEGKPVDSAVQSSKTDSKKCWLVVYLGLGRPRACSLKTVEHTGKALRVGFVEREAGVGPIVVDYYYWLQLEEPASGACSIELINESREALVLARTVRSK